MNKPQFVIKSAFQKGGSYKDVLTDEILRDVCQRITGRTDFDVIWDPVSYNKGRMAILNYKGIAHYISFSETGNKGRNSFFQSVPSALNSCILGIRNKIPSDQADFIRHITPEMCVRTEMMSEQMKYYIARRYAA